MHIMDLLFLCFLEASNFIHQLVEEVIYLGACMVNVLFILVFTSFEVLNSVLDHFSHSHNLVVVVGIAPLHFLICFIELDYLVATMSV